MAREHWYFLAGALAVLVPLLAYLGLNKGGWLEDRPDGLIAYKRIGELELSLHAFPAHGKLPTGPAPALLLFHGGAWQYGSPAQFYPQCRYFAARGVSCFSAEYRIESRHGSDPRAAVQDARAAFDYLLGQARALNIDPARIAVGGGSAGGHLAAALGVELPLADENRPKPRRARPAALVLYNPMLDLSPGKPDHHLVADYWLEVSPLQHVDGASPPTLILVGSQDPEVPVSTARAYCAAMEARGARCELAVYEGARHGFFNPEVEGGRFFGATNERVEQYLAALWP